MSINPEKIAEKFLKREWENLDELERRVIQSFIERQNVSKSPLETFEDDRTFGQKVADKVASFGGSWTFIGLFGGVLVTWVIINSVFLMNQGFDPYPYILLNLFLSMLAAIQAPIIMMSQNRQAARDRADAAHDYEVNLKAELEIRHLHDKLDELRERKWVELVEMQQEQIKLLEEQLKQKAS